MSVAAFRDVLEATGYLDEGQPAPGVIVDAEALSSRRRRHFSPDALWRGPSALTVYFKRTDASPDLEEVAAWRREIWNEGFAPLLWIVCPDHVDLYNGFARPRATGDAEANRLRTFKAVSRGLQELDDLAGRLAMETGQFWLRSKKVNRSTSVDRQLLADLAAVERDLVSDGLDHKTAQGLIGRSIFTQYLVDRQIVREDTLVQHCGFQSFPMALRHPRAAGALFEWLTKIFNGDMFPKTKPASSLQDRHFARIADFLEAIDPQSQQRSLFPYQFDIIPVELISSIYEQFAHSASAPPEEPGGSPSASSSEARRTGVHYTRLPVVSLVLDEVMSGLSGEETVLDLTCGSGVFLVEAFRRLVSLKGGATPSRAVIRTILYKQIFGVDLSEAAVRVAAFSMYLAALELDPDPQPPEALTFEPLIGHTLIVGDARDIERSPEGAPLRVSDRDPRRFDVIVGNPPWTFRGKAGTAERRRQQRPGEPLQPRGESLDFLLRATDFGHESTRYGIVLSAMPFFASSGSGLAAVQHAVQRLAPVTIVNLAALTWLFPTAQAPAVILLARCRSTTRLDQITIANVPWSHAGERSHTFEVTPSDIATLRCVDWFTDRVHLKTVAFGRSRDLLLLDEFQLKNQNVGTWLEAIGSELRDGLILGNRSQDATHLFGLRFLQTSDMAPFRVPRDLPPFVEPRAERPRARETYVGPLLLVKEFFRAEPRPVAAMSHADVVYSDAYFGAALARDHEEEGRLVSALLSSALASWFFLMTSSEFGVWKRRLQTRDVSQFPIPDLTTAVRSRAGQRILELEREFRKQVPSKERWAELDEAVLDLYGLDEADRSVVLDGLVRSSWQWKEGRTYWSEPAEFDKDLRSYADAFLLGMGVWLQATERYHMRAELLRVPSSSALRVVRFVLEDHVAPASPIDIVTPPSELASVLRDIGQRLGVRLSSSLIGERELRVHGAGEVVIIKPAARRFWMRSAALDDADRVFAESLAGVIG